MATLHLERCAVEIECMAYHRMKSPPTDEMHYRIRFTWQGKPIFYIAEAYGGFSPLSPDSEIEAWVDFELDDAYCSDTFFAACINQRPSDMPPTFECSFDLEITPENDIARNGYQVSVNIGRLFFGDKQGFDVAFSWNVSQEALLQFAHELRQEENARIAENTDTQPDFQPNFP